MSEDTDHTEEPQETPAAGPPEAPAAEQPDETAALRQEAAELRDKLLRALAEMENVRHRAERDRADTAQYAVAGFARDMLAIYDNFGRALAACPAQSRETLDPQVKAVIDGVEATERQLLATLERYGVKPIDTADGKFDPHLHQAIAEVPANGKPKGSIVDVVQAGFVIGERLLRPAMVTVAGASPAAEGNSGVDTTV